LALVVFRCRAVKKPIPAYQSKRSVSYPLPIREGAKRSRMMSSVYSLLLICISAYKQSFYHFLKCAFIPFCLQRKRRKAGNFFFGVKWRLSNDLFNSPNRQVGESKQNIISEPILKTFPM
jgi:hypothetical protein